MIILHCLDKITLHINFGKMKKRKTKKLVGTTDKWDEDDINMISIWYQFDVHLRMIQPIIWNFIGFNNVSLHISYKNSENIIHDTCFIVKNRFSTQVSKISFESYLLNKLLTAVAIGIQQPIEEIRVIWKLPGNILLPLRSYF